jgi:hypothetical protein
VACEVETRTGESLSGAVRHFASTVPGLLFAGVLAGDGIEIFARPIFLLAGLLMRMVVESSLLSEGE